MIRSLDTFHPKSCPLSLSVELREKDGMPMVEIDDMSKNEFNPAWPYESLHVASVPLPDIADLYSENVKGLRLDELNDALPEGYAPYLKKKDVERIREWVIDKRDKYADAIVHCVAASHNKETLLKAANVRCEEAWESIRETIESGGYNPYDIEDLARRGVAFADLAWALQLPEGQPGGLDVAEVMEAIGKDADELLDHGLADVVVWNLAEHGQMQTEAFIDYLRSVWSAPTARSSCRRIPWSSGAWDPRGACPRRCADSRSPARRSATALSPDTGRRWPRFAGPSRPLVISRGLGTAGSKPSATIPRTSWPAPSPTSPLHARPSCRSTRWPLRRRWWPRRSATRGSRPARAMRGSRPVAGGVGGNGATTVPRPSQRRPRSDNRPMNLSPGERQAAWASITRL